MLTKAIIILKGKRKMEDLENLVAELLRANVLWGKKWVACGDSFTEGDFNTSEEDFLFADGLYKGQKKVYPFFIGRRNHMTVINEARCGSTMTDLSKRKDAFSITRYKSIPEDTDYITLHFGINDDKKSPIGEITDTENTTFFGAWNTVLEYLLTSFPYTKIGIIVPNGCSKAYTDAIRAVARRWGVPYLDLGEKSTLNPMLPVHYNRELGPVENRNAGYPIIDGQHLSGVGYDMVSPMIDAWILSL